MINIDVTPYIELINHCDLLPRSGKVLQFYGLAVEGSGPAAFLGEICEIYASPNSTPVLAEVVGFREGRVLLMPYGTLRGISIGSEIIATGKEASVSIGPHLVGHVINAFGDILDNAGQGRGQAGNVDKQNEERLKSKYYYSLYPKPTNPMEREEINDVFETGIKVLDTFLTVGRGQRMGFFSGSGVGKSSLLGMIARNSNADINVIALVGERGREVIDFVKNALGEEGLKKSVIVVATADEHALVRTHAAYAATAIAEYFRDQGQHVLLAMDSVTRFAMAQREIGLAIGEPPTARGYTPSVFSALPRLVERSGNFRGKGSITAFYTVLVEGDDMNEPISDSLRAILDGHVILNREIAAQNRYPAIDILHSVSRLANSLCSSEEMTISNQAREMMATYVNAKDMIDVGAYNSGDNPKLDKAIKLESQLSDFCKQGHNDHIDRSSAYKDLANILRNV